MFSSPNYLIVSNGLFSFYKSFYKASFPAGLSYSYNLGVSKSSNLKALCSPIELFFLKYSTNLLNPAPTPFQTRELITEFIAVYIAELTSFFKIISPMLIYGASMFKSISYY